MLMILAVSGVPGTGKTSVARLLAKKLDANLIEVRKLVDSGKIKHGYDRKRKTRTVDVSGMKKAVKEKIIKDKINIVESHLSHLIDADLVVILRTNPPELKKRLEKRKWSRAKIRENVEAEIVDEITIEALDIRGKSRVLEIDTSGKKPGETAGLIAKLLKRQIDYREYLAGKTDWSGYMKVLTKL